MSHQSGIQSLDRAFDIIEILSCNPEGLHLMEVTHQTGLNKSTVHRMLSSLSMLGYVKKDQGTGRYYLTLKLFELSGRIVDGIDVLRAAKTPLATLRGVAQEAIHLVVQEGNDIVYIHKVESPSSSFRMVSRLGMRRPMYCTAVGKSILAMMKDEKVARIWEDSDIRAYTANTLVRLKDLMEELRQIREQGYALDNEENELGMRCIAAAILDYTGQSRAAFSVSGPTMRMTDARIVELVPEVLSTSALISSELGYKGKA